MGGKRGLERAKSAERGDGCVINGRRQRLLQEEKTPGKKQSKGMKKKKWEEKTVCQQRGGRVV